MLSALRWHGAHPDPDLVRRLPDCFPRLRTLSVGNWLCATVAAQPTPVADAPGTYRVIAAEGAAASAGAPLPYGAEFVVDDVAAPARERA
eukprot:gene51430-37702_t